jgi:hypothetical protein
MNGDVRTYEWSMAHQNAGIRPQRPGVGGHMMRCLMQVQVRTPYDKNNVDYIDHKCICSLLFNFKFPITTMDLEERQHYYKWEGIEATVMVNVANLQSYAYSVDDHNFVN